MAVTKRDISLEETLGLYLSYTPRYGETEQFRTDLRTLNHTLLRDAIMECVESEKAPKGAPDRTKRQAIHRVYTRKVKELAALYPLLFSVENAMRSTALQLFSNAFGGPRWWQAFLTAFQGKGEAHFPTARSGKRVVLGTEVNKAFVKNVLFVMSRMTDHQRSALADATCRNELFLESTTLKQLSKIMESDWTLCPLGNMNKTDFHTHMLAVCDARNEIFHGNPIKNRTTVFKACERILDAVNFHAGDFDLRLRDARFQRPAPTILREGRHCTPPL